MIIVAAKAISLPEEKVERPAHATNPLCVFHAQPGLTRTIKMFRHLDRLSGNFQDL
jgi:hypothetical protein